MFKSFGAGDQSISLAPRSQLLCPALQNVPHRGQQVIASKIAWVNDARLMDRSGAFNKGFKVLIPSEEAFIENPVVLARWEVASRDSFGDELSLNTVYIKRLKSVLHKT